LILPKRIENISTTLEIYDSIHIKKVLDDVYYGEPKTIIIHGDILKSLISIIQNRNKYALPYTYIGLFPIKCESNKFKFMIAMFT